MNAVQSEDESVLLNGYITSVKVLKIENGVETTVGPSGLKEGDNVKVDIKYGIENGLPNGKNTLVYQLPQNIKLSKEQSGPVMQGGTDVGKYYITTDGKITIVIDKNKFDDGEAFSYLLYSIRCKLGIIDKIDRENVLDYGIIGNKRVLKMQYVLIEDIASKKEN